MRTGSRARPAILRRRHLAPAFVPPISVILAANKEPYISGLTAYREGRVEAIGADAAVRKLIDVLTAQPVITLPTAVAKIERTKPAISQAIEQLAAANVLIPISGGKRNRVWEALGLLDLLVRLESGETPEGEPELGPIPERRPW